jgi:hypothetical protein
MKLTKVAEAIISEDSCDSLRKCIAELERNKDPLQHLVDLSAEYYDLLVAGNKKLAFESDQLNLRCESLHAKMVQIRSNANNSIADLEAKVKFAETHGVEIVAEGNRKLKDFESGLVRKLEGLREMNANKVCTIGGLCSPMLVEEPSVKDYVNWFSEEVTSLPDMLCGMNENFATAAIEGVLALAGDLVDFDAVRVAASEGGADVLPVGSGVRKAARAISKKWWCSFGYDCVLSVICTQQMEVLF